MHPSDKNIKGFEAGKFSFAHLEEDRNVPTYMININETHDAASQAEPSNRSLPAEPPISQSSVDGLGSEENVPLLRGCSVHLTRMRYPLTVKLDKNYPKKRKAPTCIISYEENPEKVNPKKKN